MARYVVTYERDEGGWWIAELHGVPGVNSDGRTVADARRRVREAPSLAVGDAAAERAELVDDVKLPAAVARVVKQATSARVRAEKLQEETIRATTEAARVLTGKLGLSVRDAAALLGVSHQRIQQVKKPHKAA
ncbi:MAG: type II toxin-antitoxin system HicB family antitoxin [Anaeromyxobacteraceae bacterium]